MKRMKSLKHLVESGQRDLNKNERNVLAGRKIGLTYARIAMDMGFTLERARQLFHRAEKILSYQGKNILEVEFDYQFSDGRK